ncbi:hypothetical protein BC829DRAFT_387137, partial [Chytridium lagenaria]
EAGETSEATGPEVQAASSDSSSGGAAGAAAGASSSDVPAPAQERVVVTFDGQEVDITGSDDLRGEVLREHIREQRQRAARLQLNLYLLTFRTSWTLYLLIFATKFFCSRGLVLASRQVDMEDLQGPSDIDPASLLAALDPNLRQAILMDQDDNFISGLPPSLAAEANAALRQPMRRRMQVPGGPNGESSGISPAKRVNREIVQLVDKPALMTLIRMLFVPEPSNRTVLHRLLLNLSENGKTRMDMISLLLSILADGSADIAAVDRSFASLSLGKRSRSQTPRKPPSLSNLRSTWRLNPNLVTQSSSRSFFGRNENFGSSLKKGKGKEKTGPSYPIAILLGLLERPTFLNSQSLLEQLVLLLSTVLKHIAVIVKRNEESAKAAAKKLEAAKNESVVEEGSSLSQTVDGDAETRSQKTKNALKPPALPESNLQAIVNVLKAGECSQKTFQYTLSILQNMAMLEIYRSIILSELSESARFLAADLTTDISTLKASLARPNVHLDVNEGVLSKFSQSSATQAKLLRILKAIDFMLSKTPTSQSGGLVRSTSEDVLSQPHVKEGLIAVYDKVDFLSLWAVLGQLLGEISETAEMVHVATVVLPLIEAFMVVSKPYVVTTQAPGAAKTFTFSRSFKALSEATNDEMFYLFTEEHRKVLNAMVRNNPSLMSGSFSLLVHNSRILEFDNKRTYFNQQLHKRTGREGYGVLQINVRRAHVFEDSYHQLHGRSGDEIKYGKLSVRFHEEEGVDAGGVTREWFSVLARQMFNPDYALFKPSAVDKVTYQPNRSSWINPDHLLYFRFVGRVIGKAIYDGRLLDAYFTRSFYKAMLEIPVDWKDIEAIDPEFHKSLEWMLNNDITDVLDITFSTEVDEFGRKKILDLQPNGRNIAVTEENKLEYVKLITEQKLVTAIKQQIDAFLGGFYDVIPKDLVKIFNEQELELLISGLPDIDIDDWKNNTEYQNYTSSSPQIQWFWRAVRSFSQEERAKLIQFVTGTSKVPLEGFKALEGSGGVQKFQIHKDFSSTSRLPSAHTCFNQVDLPEYESYEQLRGNLWLPFRNVELVSFGFV